MKMSYHTRKSAKKNKSLPQSKWKKSAAHRCNAHKWQETTKHSTLILLKQWNSFPEKERSVGEIRSDSESLFGREKRKTFPQQL